MTFYIYVRSGINNKLVPLLSLLRIAKKENRKIKCCWGEDAYINKSLFSFLDLFKNINDIEFINMNEYINVFNNVNNKIYNRDGSDRNRNEIIYKKDPNTIIVFNKIVHLISYKEDNVIGNYVPYPRENKETTQIISELRDIVKDLIPVQEIQNKINETTNTFKNKNVIGLHVRTTDGGFTDIPYKDVFGFINKLLDEDNNKDKKVYVSCDNLSLENEIKETFSNKVLFFSNPFGSNYADKFNRSSSGTINAVCEMFILSRCNKFYGTPGSSLSFMVWLLRSDKFLDFWCKNPWN
jgi:hypothetical protein